MDPVSNGVHLYQMGNIMKEGVYFLCNPLAKWHPVKQLLVPAQIFAHSHYLLSCLVSVLKHLI